MGGVSWGLHGWGALAGHLWVLHGVHLRVHGSRRIGHVDSLGHHGRTSLTGHLGWAYLALGVVAPYAAHADTGWRVASPPGACSQHPPAPPGSAAAGWVGLQAACAGGGLIPAPGGVPGGALIYAAGACVCVGAGHGSQWFVGARRPYAACSVCSAPQPAAAYTSKARCSRSAEGTAEKSGCAAKAVGAGAAAPWAPPGYILYGGAGGCQSSLDAGAPGWGWDGLRSPVVGEACGRSPGSGGAWPGGGG